MNRPGRDRLHVAVIMDGNGRWAGARGQPRLYGHAAGARRVSEIVRACPEIGVSHLTLFAFSTENWRRPAAEIRGLMRIFVRYIRRQMRMLRAHDVRVRFIGRRERLPARLCGLMEELEAATARCRGLTLTLALDYGGRDEITRAVASLAADVAAGRLAPEAIDEISLARRLDTAFLPDPDLVIRSSGERRVSNFLLWQSAYAEYLFDARLWPDFDAAALAEAVAAFHARVRRFGAAEPALPRAVG